MPDCSICKNKTANKHICGACIQKTYEEVEKGYPIKRCVICHDYDETHKVVRKCPYCDGSVHLYRSRISTFETMSSKNDCLQSLQF